MCPGIGMGTSPCEQSFMDALQVCYEYESDFRGNKHYSSNRENHTECVTEYRSLATRLTCSATEAYPSFCGIEWLSLQNRQTRARGVRERRVTRETENFDSRIRLFSALTPPACLSSLINNEMTPAGHVTHKYYVYFSLHVIDTHYVTRSIEALWNAMAWSGFALIKTCSWDQNYFACGFKLSHKRCCH